MHASLNAAINAARKGLTAKANGGMPRLVLANANAAPQDFNTIISFNEPNTGGNGIYTASALSSVVGGTTVTNITVSITDPTGTTVYATNQSSQYAQGTDFIVPVTATNVPAGAAAPIAKATITYTPQSGGPQQVVYASAQLMQPANLGCMTAPNYCVKSGANCTSSHSTACTNTGQPSLPAISVCYLRGSASTCDYFNNTGQSPTNFVFPAAGSVTFSTSIASPLSGTWSAQVQDTVNGGVCVLSQDAAMDSQWSINNTQLRWNMAQLSLTAPTYCLHKSGGQSLNFYFTGNVQLTGTGNNASGTYSFTSNGTAGRGNYIVPQLYFEDSCIAAGAQVTLADGKSKRIEKISADHHDVVRTGLGEEREVLGTASGIESHPMYRIKTNKKNDLLLTRTHPVITAKGAVMARDLRVGEHVMTDKGPTKIVSITHENYSGRVYNLRLGDMQEAEKGLSTFYANGILVGDLKTQTYYEKREIEMNTKDAARTRERLARDFPEWLVDFDNHHNILQKK
jgi:hypothetical protein